MLSASLHAPTVCFLSRSCPTSLPPPPMAVSACIAVVGDVHDYWYLEEDRKALQLLQPDVVLFTGDFVEENVELVQSVANLKFPKAVILGNHDTWYTQQFSGKKKDAVQLQLESLDGQSWQRAHSLSMFGVSSGKTECCWWTTIFLWGTKGVSERASVCKIWMEVPKKFCKAALSAPEDHLLVLLAHNGPTVACLQEQNICPLTCYGFTWGKFCCFLPYVGLGSKVDDICGKDWVYEGGDHGDPDLEQAISTLKDSNKVYVPLVVFGHMHKELAHGNGLRKIIVVSSDDTVYLNGAIFPRVRTLIDEQAKEGTSNSYAKHEAFANLSLQDSEGTMRAFTVVDILDGRVDKIAESWVSVVGDKVALEEEHVLFKRGNFHSSCVLVHQHLSSVHHIFAPVSTGILLYTVGRENYV